jgi:hypothetical protein
MMIHSPIPPGDAPALQTNPAMRSPNPVGQPLRLPIHPPSRQATRPPTNNPVTPSRQATRLPYNQSCDAPALQTCDASPNPVGQPLRLPVHPQPGRRGARPTILRRAPPTTILPQKHGHPLAERPWGGVGIRLRISLHFGLRSTVLRASGSWGQPRNEFHATPVIGQPGHAPGASARAAG